MHMHAQFVEAVIFFDDHGTIKEMLFPEFEAVLDGVVNMHDYADDCIPVAYVLITPNLHVCAAVFFSLDFDEYGGVDPGWDMPLRSLVNTAELGPDLGAGATRWVTSDSCPDDKHLMHLWTPEPLQVEALVACVQRNGLGLISLDSLSAPLEVAEPAIAIPEGPSEQDQAFREKSALLLQKQKQLLAALLQERNDLQNEQQRLQASLVLAERELAATREQLSLCGEQIAEQGKELEQLGRMLQSEQSRLKEQAREMQRILTENALPLAQIGALESGMDVLERIDEFGGVVVIFQPGSGHLNLNVHQLKSFLDDPIAFTAKRCLVSKLHYEQWLAHYQDQQCQHVSQGIRCTAKSPLVKYPKDFTPKHLFCAEHQ